jgi:outer membrane protein assembly factor BamB
VRRFGFVLFAVSLAAPMATARPGEPCAWPMYAHDAGHSGAQTPGCSELSRTNVPTLLPAWVVPTSDNITATPVVAGGILYVGSWDGTFYAVDAARGDVLWTFKVDDPNRVAFGRIVSTAAVDRMAVPGAGDVDVVLFGGGGTLYALAPGRAGPRVLAQINVDPRDSALRAEQADDPPQIEIESSPVVGHLPHGDRVFVGMDVHNREGIGRTGLLAFSLRPNPGGHTPYRFELAFTFDPETGIARHSLTEGSGEGWGCGGVWSSPALDAHARGGNGIVFFGTSNCDNPTESDHDGEIGREALFAIDASTGQEVWRFQPRGPNEIDDDFGSSPNLLPGGLVGEGGKDGWYYARDRATGAEAWSVRAAQAGHLNPGFAIGGYIGTGAVGSSRDPLSGRKRDAVFVASAIPTPIDEPLDGPPRPGNIDTSLLRDPGRLLSVAALDASTGKILWRSPLAAPAYGHVTYANGVVLASITFSFRIQAFDADTGATLWLAPTLGAPSSAPVVVGDALYVGAGTRETDAEFKAFGDRIQQLLSGPLGEHPLSRLSGIFAYRLRP